MPRVRKYQDGGDVNDLLKMLNAHGSAAPKDKELLSSLASETTQPSGYTAPVLPVDNKIDLIPKPLTNEEMFGAITPMYEGQNPNTAWMYGAMNNMPPSVAKKWRDENPGTSPEGINMMGVLGAAGYASLGVVIPGTSNIVGGVTIGDALNAYFFKEGIEGGIKHIPEFIDDPSWSGANDITWDALKVLPGMQGLKNNVLKPFVDAYKKAKKASTTASTATSSPLQQLAGNKPKVKGKGKEAYEHVNTYDKSNVAASANGAGLNSGVYQYPSFMTGSKIQGQVSKDGTIARSTLEQLVKNTNTRKSEALAVESTLSEFEGNRIPYSDFKKALSSSIQPAVIITTPKEANKGVRKLGYENVDLNIEDTALMTPEEIASIDANGNFLNGKGVSTKTILYNDPAFPSSTKHFEDPNSFWIRSLVSKIEPNVYYVLETQTDVPSLKGKWDTRTIPASGEINVFLTERNLLYEDFYTLKTDKDGIGMRGQIGRASLPDPSRNMNSQKHYILTEIKRIKDGTIQGWEIEALQKKIDRALPILNNPDQLIGRIDRNKTVDQVVLEMRESVKNLKAEIKNIEKKHADNLVLYEQALEMFPNALKNSPALAKQKRDAKGMPLRFINEALLDAGRGGQTVLMMPTAETVHTIEGWNGIDWRGMTEEAIRKLKESQATITKRYTDFPKLWKNEFGTEVRNITGPKGNTWYAVDVPKKFFQIDPSKPAEIKTYKQGGALKGLIKKYGAGGSVGGWGAQGNFTTEYTSKQPDVEELEDPNLIPELNALAAQQESGGDPLTPEEERKLKGKKALQGAGKGAMAGASFGPWGAVIGGVVGGAIGYFAKKGTKIKKSLYDNGGLFEALREKRADRRIAKTPVRDANSSDLLDMLDNYKESVGVPAGQYDPKEREIVMFKDDPDTLKHEQVHASQYGPLQRLAYRVNSDRSARIQNPTTRKSYRKLTSGKDMVDDRTFNDAGQFILGKGEEFEAVLGTGVNAAKEKGVNFNVSFEEILSQLKNISSPTNNMRGLMKFMSNKFTKEQRDLILKSIR